MKKLFLLLALFSFVVTACERGSDVEEENGNTPFVPEIEISSELLDFPTEGGEQNIRIIANFKYSITTKDNWISYKENESGLVISVDKNQQTKNRYGTIKLFSKDYNIEKSILVTQDAFKPHISIQLSSISFPNEGGSQEIAISSNIEYDIVRSDEWVLFEQTENGLIITAIQSYTNKERTASISIVNEQYNISKKIEIIQSAFIPTIIINPTSLEFTYSGGSQEVSISADINILYKIPDDINWVSVESTSGGIKVSALPNNSNQNRQTDIIFYSNQSDIEKKLHITQTAFEPFLEVDVNKLNVPNEGGVLDINVTTNIEYKVSIDAEYWIDAVNMGNKIRVYVTDNTTSQNRYAEITLTNKEYNIEKKVIVEQLSSNPNLIIDPDHLTFTFGGGTKEIKIIANFEYEIIENTNWLSVATVNNINGQSIKVTASANNTNQDRQAKITIFNNEYNIKKEITVEQNAFNPILTVDPDIINFTSNGGSQKVTIAANIDYQISYSVNWISVKYLDDGIEVIASKFDTVGNRKTEISIWNNECNISKTISVFQQGISTTNSNTIYYTTSNNEILTPKNSYGFGANIIYNQYDNNSKIGLIIFDGDVTSIGTGAFEDCSTLTSIIIPDSATSIDNYAFFNCFNLQDVTIGKSVSSIKDYAFGECMNLKSMTIPDSVISIGERAFYYCSNLSTLIIGKNVMTIGNNAFNSCGRLTHISIPDSVTHIGDNAFSDCYSLTNVTIGNGLTKINDYTFSGCEQLQKVSIGKNVKSIGDYAFNYCMNIRTVILPDSINSVGNHTFAACTNLTDITIPDSVVSIGEYAFYGCLKLINVTIGKNVTTIGDWAFYTCTNLEYVTCKPIIPPTIGPQTFLNNHTSLTIYVPQQSLSAYKKDVIWGGMYILSI